MQFMDMDCSIYRQAFDPAAIGGDDPGDDDPPWPGGSDPWR